jgi:NitT/TauT family transport system substrate-binding protein
MKKLTWLLLILMTGCREKSAAPAGPMRLGLVTWIGYGPFYVAKEKGFFKENNVEVDLQRIEGDVERRAAIASGQLDGIALTLDAMIVLRTHGIPLRTVMAIDGSSGGDGLVAVSAIKKVEELKGKQIAFPTGLPSHFFLYTVLKQHEMKMSDVKPIAMDADQAGAAFASGKIDAAVTWEPWLSKASDVGRGHVLASSREFPGTIEDVLFMREDVIGKRSREIEGIIRAWYKAVDFVTTNPTEAKAIMAKAFNLPDEKVTMLLAGIRYEGKQGNQAAFGTSEKPGFLYPLYDRITEAWMSEGVISKRDKPEDGIDPGMMRRIE